MTYPIPGVPVSTPYGRRGSSWSCDENSDGHGVHTGVDFGCSAGTNITAPIAGTIRHRSYGSAFGNHQFAISPDSNQPFGDGEVFFAHTTNRPPDGARVNVGDYLAEVGTEGNVTGPHLHFEYHPSSKGAWSCTVHANPQPVLDAGAETPPPQTGDDELTPDDREWIDARIDALDAHTSAQIASHDEQIKDLISNLDKHTSEQIASLQKQITAI